MRPRVTRGDFRAFMMSSAERCSAAYDGAGDSRPATKIMPAKPAILVLVIMDVSPIRSEFNGNGCKSCHACGWGAATAITTS